jgi:hypothetical protein
MKKKLTRSPCIGRNMILGVENLPKTTKKIIDLLYSEGFKSGEITYYYMWKHLDLKRETVKYWYYKIYLPEKFKTRYLKLSTGKK